MGPNTISSVTLVAVQPLNGGVITLQRKRAPESLVDIWVNQHVDEYDIPPEPPARRPIPARPDDNTVSLKLELTEKLDEGGSSVVYAATAVLDNDEDRKYALPPLVVKVARRCRRGHLAREAWFYDELHELQGSVIPRCYGWFEATEASSFPGAIWAPDDPYDERKGRASYYPEPWGPALDKLAARRNYISVLILERLWGTIPVGEYLNPKLCNDVLSLGESLDPYRVLVRDVRHCNIMKADGPGSLPSEPSPVTNRVHEWRIIDLEGAMKGTLYKGDSKDAWFSYAERLLDDLPTGNIIEPWE